MTIQGNRKEIYLKESKKENSEAIREIENKNLNKVKHLITSTNYCIGIEVRKIEAVLSDWQILVDAINNNNENCSRVKLKEYLLNLERNPSQTIKRILRLLHESAIRANCEELSSIQYFSPTLTESTLVNILGSHQFQAFAESFATVVKIDYALRFFRSIICACIRRGVYGDNDIKRAGKHQYDSPIILNTTEIAAFSRYTDEDKLEMARKITVIFIRVLEALVSRYSGVLNYNVNTPRRFGFQLRSLTADKDIWYSIISLLCFQDFRQATALTWIVDEISIWSFD